jgi:membrane associated rhomboid family serine protease
VTRGTGGPEGGFWQAPATYVLIGLNVLAFLAEIATGSGGLSRASGTVFSDFALQGAAVSEGEWYRLATGAFLHAGLLHIALNLFALFIVGRLLEPGIGTPRYVALYVASMFAGSFGALALTHPFEPTVGASGAIFGLFAATAVIARGRGLNAIANELAVLIVINLVFTFSIPGLSIGGHLGGLVGGALCALAIVAGERGMLGRQRFAAEMAAMTAIALVSVAGALVVA